jgi:inhibitor of KinA
MKMKAMPRKCNRGNAFHTPDCIPLGEAALLIRLGATIDPQVNAAVLALEKALLNERLPGLRATVPAYVSLTVHFDPLEISCETLTDVANRLLATIRLNGLKAGRTIDVPVVYGGVRGPDLDFVARHCGMSCEQVIALHSAATYRVHFIGFLPGFPYLGGMDPRLQAPRLETPRTIVPAGSVGIAGLQTGVYPLESPGGWRIIGWTPLRLFDPDRNPPTLLTPGDSLRFIPVSEQELANAAGD